MMTLKPSNIGKCDLFVVRSRFISRSVHVRFQAFVCSGYHPG